MGWGGVGGRGGVVGGVGVGWEGVVGGVGGTDRMEVLVIPLSSDPGVLICFSGFWKLYDKVNS